MKRLLAIFLSAAMLAVSLGSTVFAAEETESTPAAIIDAADLQEAKNVLGTLIGEDALFADSESLSRADFVTAMLRFMQIAPIDTQNYFFTDVPSFETFAASVYTAAEMGWISKGTEFEPNRAITKHEALKIVIRMLNYEVVAQSKGGYPAGDLYVGGQLELLDDLDMSYAEVSSDEAYMLLYHAAFVPTFQQLLYGDEEKYTENGETLAYRTYKAYEVEGVVNRTPYNTLDGEEAYGRGEIAEIDGVAYEVEDVAWDLLGVKVRAVAKENVKGGRDTLLCLRDLSDKKTIALDDIEEKNGNVISYWTEDASKTKTVKLSRSAQMILNGRKLTEGVEESFARGVGNVVLADNDQDGLYDAVFINRYSYAVAASYDSVTDTFRDQNNSASTYSFDQKAVILRSETGESIDPLSIGADEVYRVISSKDREFVLMQRIEGAVTGMVSKINLSEKTMKIDKTEYILSEYFIDNFAKTVQELTERTFRVDGNVLISASADGSDLRYGYLLGCQLSGAFRKDMEIRVYTTAAEFEELTVASKVIFDGAKNTKSSDVYAALTMGGSVTPQLIKYSLSGDGEVRCIDTATTTLPTEAGVYTDKNNSLTKYESLSINLPYSGSTQAMGARYTVSGASVFCIPTDITQEEEFAIRGSDFFVHDQWYQLGVYDMNEKGAPGALVHNGTSPYKVHPDDAYLLIQEIVTKLNEDGETMYEIRGWRSGSYITIDMDEEFAASITKNAAVGTPVDSTHSVLSGGDIVGIKTDAKSNLKAINIVYDAREGVMAANVNTVNNDVRTAPMYYEGVIDRIEGDYAVLSIKKNGGSWDLSQDSLRYVKMPTANMASYNAKTGLIRPMAASDIRTYQSDGADAHHVVFCMSNFVVKTAVFYEDMEARR